MKWQFVNTGFRHGKFNMEYDEYLAKRLLEGNGLSTVRVYGWEPYAISLGYHQSEHDINLERCRIDGIDLVRRPTGGRAILHAHELTYSVVMFSEGRSVAQSYEYISTALVKSLWYLGIEAEIAKNAVNFSDFYRNNIAASCFASISLHEVQCRGKKIIGSAQRRYSSPEVTNATVVLQHGSILLGPQHHMLAEYIVPDNSKSREVMRTILEHKTIEVESILQRSVLYDEAAEAVRKGFESAWGITFTNDEHVQHTNFSEGVLRTKSLPDSGLAGKYQMNAK